MNKLIGLPILLLAFLGTSPVHASLNTTASRCDGIQRDYRMAREFTETRLAQDASRSALINQLQTREDPNDWPPLLESAHLDGDAQQVREFLAGLAREQLVNRCPELIPFTGRRGSAP